MNPRQRSVLLIGIFFVGVTGLFPPWVFVDEYFTLVGKAERSAGYHFFFSPPPPEAPHTEHERFLIGTASRIDTRRLTVEWAAIVLVVIGLLLLLRSRPIPPQASESTKGPLVDPGSTEVQKTTPLSGRPPANVSRNLPNEPPKASGETRRLLEFSNSATRQEFNAATAAIFQGLKIEARDKERAYHWIIENRHRFTKLVLVGGEPRNGVEAAVVACAIRLMPDIEKHFRSITWATHRVTHIRHRVAAHWALAELLDERVDLDALAQEAVEAGLTYRMVTDHDPLFFLMDRQNPQLPPWLPEDWGPNGRLLTSVEKVEWFDELLRREYGTSNGWPPNDDIDTRRQEVVLSLYRMYIDLTNGALPKPSFVHNEGRSESSNKGPMRR